jgi:hypothetical protein
MCNYTQNAKANIMQKNIRLTITGHSLNNIQKVGRQRNGSIESSGELLTSTTCLVKQLMDNSGLKPHNLHLQREYEQHKLAVGLKPFT